MRIMRENLGWAFAYNVIVIPLAAFGYITPALAAVGMAASSLLVVGNALRAAR
jgi:Cu2+-exporting ATPase